jgi:hypothetical protein
MAKVYFKKWDLLYTYFFTKYSLKQGEICSSSKVKIYT